MVSQKKDQGCLGRLTIFPDKGNDWLRGLERLQRNHPPRLTPSTAKRPVCELTSVVDLKGDEGVFLIWVGHGFVWPSSPSVTRCVFLCGGFPLFVVSHPHSPLAILTTLFPSFSTLLLLTYLPLFAVSSCAFLSTIHHRSSHGFIECDSFFSLSLFVFLLDESHLSPILLPLP